MIEEDKDFDDKPDALAEFNPDGSKKSEQQDTNDDGKYDVTIHYAKGAKVRVEEDTNADGKADVITFYDGDRIARREADTDHDGRFETVASYEKGIERRQAQDKDGDGKPELVILLDERGEKVREEVDTKAAGRADLVRVLRRRQARARGGGPDGRRQARGRHHLGRRHADPARGRHQRRRTPRHLHRLQGGEKASQEEDRDGDGKIDARYAFDAKGVVVSEKLDDDHDGSFEITNELVGGKLAKRTVASGKSGAAARIESFENGKLAKAELDENGDGRTDLWNFHDASGALVRQEQDANHDGKVDTWIALDAKSGKELEVRKDANFDGKIDSVRKTDAAGVPQQDCTGGRRLSL